MDAVDPVRIIQPAEPVIIRPHETVRSRDRAPEQGSRQDSYEFHDGSEPEAPVEVEVVEDDESPPEEHLDLRC